MKKIYASLLAGLACLTAQNASAYKVTVEVDNPSAVKAMNNGTEVVFTDGAAEVEYSDYGSLNIESTDPYVLTGLQEKSSSSASWNTGYLNSARSHYISLSGEYTDGYSYKITTGNLNELRTATVTLKVDNPSAIRFMRSWTNETIVPTDEETEIRYVPGKETPFSISTISGKNLYKLTAGGQEISGSYGNYSIYNVSDGDVIDVQVNYPDVKQNLVFNLSDECREGFITSVTVDNQPLADWQNAQVQLGASVSVSYNTSDFKITRFDKNGSPISSYGFYSPYTFVMDTDVTFDIEAAPYATVPMTVKVAKADYVILYKGYDSSNPDNVYTLNDGESTINVSETEGVIRLKASPLATITSVTQDGTPLSKDYSNTYNLTVKDGSVIEIMAEEIRRDDTLIFYFDSPEKANDSSKGFYGYGFRANDSQRSITLEEGYNEIKFGNVDGQFMFSVNNGKTDNVFLYVNGEIPEFQSDYLSYYFTPADGDVLKCFVGERPSSYSLTFEVANDVQTPEVTLDRITKLESLDDMTVLQGTSVSIKPAEEGTINVKVGDTTITPADGAYEFAVNADSAVKITKDDGSAIENIHAEEVSGKVYNMQGIQVNPDNLPAGLYIINGKKTIIR